MLKSVSVSWQSKVESTRASLGSRFEEMLFPKVSSSKLGTFLQVGRKPWGKGFLFWKSFGIWAMATSIKRCFHYLSHVPTFCQPTTNSIQASASLRKVRPSLWMGFCYKYEHALLILHEKCVEPLLLYLLQSFLLIIVEWNKGFGGIPVSGISVWMISCACMRYSCINFVILFINCYNRPW